jgi:hypothetical protein
LPRSRNFLSLISDRFFGNGTRQPERVQIAMPDGSERYPTKARRGHRSDPHARDSFHAAGILQITKQIHDQGVAAISGNRSLLRSGHERRRCEPLRASPVEPASINHTPGRTHGGILKFDEPQYPAIGPPSAPRRAPPPSWRLPIGIQTRVPVRIEPANFEPADFSTEDSGILRLWAPSTAPLGRASGEDACGQVDCSFTRTRSPGTAPASAARSDERPALCREPVV